MRRLPPFLRANQGAAAAEMVLLLPLVLVLIFTTFEAAHYMWSEHKVIKGVRDAARYAGRLQFSQYDCSSNTFLGNSTQVKNLARTGQLSGGTAVVSGWADSDITIAVSCVTRGGLYTGNGGNAPRVTVATKFSYPSLMGSLGLPVGAFNIGASAQSPVMGL